MLLRARRESRHELSARDVHHRAGDVARVVRREEDERGRELRELRWTAERSVLAAACPSAIASERRESAVTVPARYASPSLRLVAGGFDRGVARSTAAPSPDRSIMRAPP